MNATNNGPGTDGPPPVTACPQCGRPLSAWEQVLLRVDRALMCKGCRRRIMLNPFEDQNAGEDKKPPGEL
jgi:hypothetical protein